MLASKTIKANIYIQLLELITYECNKPQSKGHCIETCEFDINQKTPSKV